MTIAIPIIFTIIVFFFPECPQSLIKQNKLVQAEKSFRFYRGISKTNEMNKKHTDEFDLFMLKISSSTDEEKVTLKDFSKIMTILIYTFYIILTI